MWCVCNPVLVIVSMEGGRSGKVSMVAEVCSVPQGHVECEGPNNRLYEFTGNLQLEEHR